MSELEEKKHRVTVSELVTRKAFLDLFDERVHDQINKNIDRTDVDGIVCFENQQMDSSRFGDRTALIYGYGCGCKELDYTLDQHLGDMPSRHQWPTYHFVKPVKE